jgi:hypothetical protein
MRATLHEKRQADRGSVAFSIAAHIIAIALIASITFRYPIGAFFGHDKVVREKIQYVQVRPAPVQSIGNGAEEKPKPKKAVKPAPLVAPVTTPTELPPVAPPSASSGAISGTATGTGGAPAGIATGIEPSLPDPRIELRPNTLRLPLSTAQKNDSAVKAIYMAYREAEIATEESRGRSPKDWTIERNGQKFGLDSQYIYLGKFKVPSAILAALPFNTGGVDGTRIIEGRNADWIRNDIYSHSQGMSEDDFRAAIKRIRERKDREKKEAEDEKKAPPKATPIVP